MVSLQYTRNRRSSARSAGMEELLEVDDNTVDGKRHYAPAREVGPLVKMIRRPRAPPPSLDRWCVVNDAS